MSDILTRIVARKREEVEAIKAAEDLGKLRATAEASPVPPSFRAALLRSGISLVAEVKKASPSRGVIREDFDPAEIAVAYETAGASCLSVLTDSDFFQGSMGDLRAVKSASSLPILRKDFTIDPVQLLQARAAGASAILLIVAILQYDELVRLANAAHELKLNCLVEVHDERELAVALRLCDGLPGVLIGVNNRDLRSFDTDLAVSERLGQAIGPAQAWIAESGIHSHADLLRMERAGASAVLVGEGLLRETDLLRATHRLLGDASMNVNMKQSGTGDRDGK